jgi:hypothetical protein
LRLINPLPVPRPQQRITPASEQARLDEFYAGVLHSVGDLGEDCAAAPFPVAMGGCFAPAFIE